MVFWIPKGPKGFHSLMINAEEHQKDNLKIIQATFIGSTDMTSELLIQNYLQEVQSIL